LGSVPVPEESAALLHVGDDIADLGMDDFVVEKIGQPFTITNGARLRNDLRPLSLCIGIHELACRSLPSPAAINTKGIPGPNYQAPGPDKPLDNSDLKIRPNSSAGPNLH
jgi:hypothetical protein